MHKVVGIWNLASSLTTTVRTASLACCKLVTQTTLSVESTFTSDGCPQDKEADHRKSSLVAWHRYLICSPNQTLTPCCTSTFFWTVTEVLMCP